MRVDAPRSVCERLHRALSVEGEREIPRTQITMSINEGFEIKIRASDLHALRAALNSYMRWLSLALDIEEVIDNGS
ncbi:MAG: hypothetical protein GXO25_03795 [Euryarchaeota archaeon]|nr:hypothetical protein [Euryarchaeota archaeon]